MKNKLTKKNLSTLVFSILFLIFIYQIFEASSMNSSEPEEILDKEIFGIAKVTDGDTIKIADKKIRLVGIDAPETKQICLDAKNVEYACGMVAKMFLIRLIEDQEVKCFYSKLDIYKRYLAKCYIEDIDINEELVKTGMAVVYTFGTKDLDLILLEKQAKEDKMGVWQGAFEMPKDYRKSKKQKIISHSATPSK